MSTTATIQPVEAPSGTETQVIDLSGPFTLAEVADIEKASGVPLSRWFDGETPEGDLRAAIVWIYLRRADPTITLDDAAAGTSVIPPRLAG